MRLRKERVKENLEQLRSFSLESSPELDALGGSYNDLTMQYTAALNKIDRALKQPIVMD